MSIPANKQGIVHPLSFDPNGTQFRNTAETGDAAQCDPANAVTCGNLTVRRLVPKRRSGAALPTAAPSQVVTLNEMLNFCFVNVSLGLNTDENVFITQEQVTALSNLCSDSSILWTENDQKDQCCMNISIDGNVASVMRRDLLLAAGCRSTAFSRNNGKFHCTNGEAWAYCRRRRRKVSQAFRPAAGNRGLSRQPQTKGPGPPQLRLGEVCLAH